MVNVEGNRVLRMVLAELDRQLREATLNYVRYGRGRDRFLHLQGMYHQYLDAVQRGRAIPEEKEAVTDLPLAA